MSSLLIKYFPGLHPYELIWQTMRNFTEQRYQNPKGFNDQLWILEHEPVFTQGQAGKPEHILNPGQIPIVLTDRGGQVTYHGPGQLMIYTLLDLKELKLTTREFVRKLEQSIIKYLHQFNLNAQGNPDAPGVYINHAKICSIGLRIRHGFSYHGLAFNINMDLTPFSYINPCGYKGLAMTQLKDWQMLPPLTEMIPNLGATIAQEFGYNQWKLSNYQQFPAGSC